MPVKKHRTSYSSSADASSGTNGGPSQRNGRQWDQADIRAPHPGAQQAENFGIVLREFYPPEMGNARCDAYNNGTLERPIETLNRAVEATEKDRKSIKPKNAVVHWFKSDLRLNDNRALHRAYGFATKNDVPLICLYILSPQDLTAHLASPARVDLTLRTLGLLKKELAKLDIPLYMETQEKRRQVPARVVELCEKWSVSHLYANLEYEVDELRRDAKLVTLCCDHGIAFETVHDTCVVTPGELHSQQGRQFAVYIPWYRAWMAYVSENPETLDVRDAPDINARNRRSHFADLFDSTVPEAPANKRLGHDEKMRFKELYPEGEHAAMDRLKAFLEKKVKAYDEKRSILSGSHTSILSPYFASGALSARTAVATAREANNKSLDRNSKGLAS
jgi:deoxyribodipyrimidine photo-lyase